MLRCAVVSIPVDALRTVFAVVVALLAAWAVTIVLIWRFAPNQARLLDVVRLLPDVLRLAASLAADPTTPRSSRVALAVLAVWIASPIDLIPEFVPVIGPLDDIVVAAIVLRWVGRRVGEETLRSHWPGSAEGFGLVLRLLGRGVSAAG
jgi:uncharacterized membrane protein YkvA (DUF1232 family)